MRSLVAFLVAALLVSTTAAVDSKEAAWPEPTAAGGVVVEGTATSDGCMRPPEVLHDMYGSWEKCKLSAAVGDTCTLECTQK